MRLLSVLILLSFIPCLFGGVFNTGTILPPGRASFAFDVQHDYMADDELSVHQFLE